MPLQNRVTPFGEIVAIPERGTMMGNRGILHDAAGRLHRRWATRAWLCCVLEFQGRREPVMAPGRYTRLFFLDEPTALAAGHRPCAFCRRDAYNAFRAAWADGNASRGLGPAPRAVEMDRVMHGERLGPGGTKRLHRTELAGLPDGVFFTLDVAGVPPRDASTIAAGDRPDRPSFLIWRGDLWRWTPRGYEQADAVRADVVLTLTPPSVVAALATGYAPNPPVGFA